MTTTSSRTETQLTIRAKAFSHEGVKTNRVLVDQDGVVSVWDSVAGHYTTCHSLSRSAMARIRKMAGSEEIEGESYRW